MPIALGIGTEPMLFFPIFLPMWSKPHIKLMGNFESYDLKGNKGFLFTYFEAQSVVLQIGVEHLQHP